MSDAKWTKEQLEAITEKDCSLLVAAAAGAGKTAVLVERIIRKITDQKDPVDIDRLLTVTFTNAAAAEMRERIAEAVSSALEESPGSKNIQRQLVLLNKASITTIHSFCLEVIRGNFQKLGIDPGFRIADETEAALIKLDVLNELFEEQYEKENPDFLELLECYGGNRDDQSLQDMVLDIYDFVQSSPWPDQWLNDMTERFNAESWEDFGETPWGRLLMDAASLELKGMRDMLADALEALKFAEGLEKYRTVLAGDLSGIDLILKSLSEGPASWDDLRMKLQSLEFGRLPAAGKDCDREKQEYAKRARDEIKTRVKKIRESILTDDTSGIRQDMGQLFPLMKCLSDLVSEFTGRYAQKKSQKSLADFNDLEHFCLAVLSDRDETGGLRPSRAALGYRERFSEILVDEYQDSNLVQESIIKLISTADSGKPNVFMVGDVKQSIYRFRQARPELFLEKYRNYSSQRGEPFRKILLYRNFRSRREVVDAVNFIFRQIMSVDAGELDYGESEFLNPGAVFEENEDARVYVGGETELHLVQTSDKGGVEEYGDSPEEGADNDLDESADEEMLDSIQCEARLAARRISELMAADGQGREFHIFDRAIKKYRRVEYRDIVILLRTMSRWSDIFLEELTNLGIPAFADTGTGFFRTTEIQVVLSLLQIIDNPLQDIPLLSVLRSPIGAFTSDDLADIRLAGKRLPLYEALKKLAVQQNGDASKKAEGFIKNLEGWRDMSFYMPTDRLIWRLYDDTGYYAMVGAMPGGAQRQANLRVLFERARQYEETSFKGLFNFINFIDKLKSSRGDMGSAKILGENDNVVRIMSIHKSKGLEFPVVILSGCGKKFNLQDMNRSILLHQELGFGPDVVDCGTRLSYPSVPKLAIREKIRIETLSEEMRILYVALTRAREKLIITGGVNDLEKAVGRWMQVAGEKEDRLQAFDMLRAGRYLDWIGPALLRHKSGRELGEFAGMGEESSGHVLDDPSQWRVRVWYRSDITGTNDSGASDGKDSAGWLDELEPSAQESGFHEKEVGLHEEESGLREEDDRLHEKERGLHEGEGGLYEDIAARLGWEYPFAGASSIPAKVSVTELKRRFDPALSEDAEMMPSVLPALVKRPRFLEERKGLSAAEAGTVLHFVMQHLDFGNEDIEGQLRVMTARELITEQQAQTVNTAKIRKFVTSPLGMRMLASGRVYREKPFNIEIRCDELYKEGAGGFCEDETILLQGVIDCYFEEPDGLVLLDYKTDYVPAGGMDGIRERYRTQMGYYARALELLTRKRVKEKYVYLFWNGEVLEY